MITSAAAPQTGRLTILWANAYCLLDTASGASISARQALMNLKERGHNVHILGATVFDSPAGVSRLRGHLHLLKQDKPTVVPIHDGPLTHQLITTQSLARSKMTSQEENAWFARYCRLLEDLKPDWVLMYGGLTLELLSSYEAKRRGIKVMARLSNGNYRGTRWCHDMRLIITDSQATAAFYQDQSGLTVHSVGPFINPDTVLAAEHRPQHVLMVNPTWAKGAMVAIAVARELSLRRPEITFEFVIARAQFPKLLAEALRRLGFKDSTLPNIQVTDNTPDMRPVFARARVLLAPSLWWDSMPRVTIEAQMNGIPVIASDHAGLHEAVAPGPGLIPFPNGLHQAPYQNLPSTALVNQICSLIIQYVDDENLYREASERARTHVAQFDIERSTDRLEALLFNPPPGNDDKATG